MSPVQPHSRASTVLVVEDDPEIREVLRWLLEHEALGTETAADGQKALDQATSIRSKLAGDAMRVSMGVLNGRSKPQRSLCIAALDKRLPVLICGLDLVDHASRVSQTHVEWIVRTEIDALWPKRLHQVVESRLAV